MNETTVQKDQLLAILRNNRSEHRSKFEQAVEVYRARLQEWLEDRLQNLLAGEKIDVQIRMPEPEDYTHEYDRAIRMLEMNVHDEIEISARHFDQLVMDRWQWTENFKMSTSSYLAE